MRSGPEFLLRKYKFTAEGHFDVHQFYYTDSSCRKPAYLLVARGTYRMGRSSFLVPGARDMEYSLATVTVMPYTDAAAALLGAAVNASQCDRPSKSSSPWKPYQKYEIFSYLEVSSVCEFSQFMQDLRQYQFNRLIQYVYAAEVFTMDTNKFEFDSVTKYLLLFLFMVVT